MRNPKYTENQLMEAVRDNESIAGTLKQIGLAISGGNYANIKMKIIQMGLDNSHFTGQGWCKGDKNSNLIKSNTFPLESILVKNSTYQCTDRLKKRLFQAGLLVEKCCLCKNGPEWNSKPLSLQIDHIDGDRTNNLLENLRILCPNCHSQTPSFAGKGKVKKK